jgi:hypothetical protein
MKFVKHAVDSGELTKAAAVMFSSGAYFAVVQLMHLTSQRSIFRLVGLEL